MPRKSKLIKIRDVNIGGGFPLIVQGMVKSDPLDLHATIREIHALKEAGAKLVRIAIPNLKAAKNISAIKNEVDVPLSADIHFNYHLAFEAMDRGIDKVRINPGNLTAQQIVWVADKAKEKKIPLRVGVNSGSLPADTADRLLKIETTREEKIILVAEAMVETTLNCVHLLEQNKFEDILISLKSSEVAVTILANKIIAAKVAYPIHLGVTATGPPPAGIIKSAIGIGALLSEGIGDTIRVSLTASSVEEIEVAYQILDYLDLVRQKPTLISCPTCGRTRGDVRAIVEEIAKVTDKMHLPIKVAVMGCEVNGPGEAREADIGVACTSQGGFLFKKGHLVKKVKKDEIVPTLIKELYSMKQNLEATQGG